MEQLPCDVEHRLRPDSNPQPYVFDREIVTAALEHCVTTGAKPLNDYIDHFNVYL